MPRTVTISTITVPTWDDAVIEAEESLGFVLEWYEENGWNEEQLRHAVADKITSLFREE